MKPHFHVVRITTRGYHLVASYQTFAEASHDTVNRSVSSSGVVLRDGTNGKRYCIAELLKLKAA